MRARRGGDGSKLHRLPSRSTNNRIAMTAIRAAAPGPVDAVAILTAGHDSLKKQFSEFRLFYLRGERVEAEAVARRICREWTIHTTIEEEIFYPEARAAIGD